MIRNVSFAQVTKYPFGQGIFCLHSPCKDYYYFKTKAQQCFFLLEDRYVKKVNTTAYFHFIV